MPVMGFTKVERFFRAAGGVSVNRDDVKRYLNFVNNAIYDLLIIGQATAKANVRDVIEPWDLPITKGLQESTHAFQRLEEEIKARAHSGVADGQAAARSDPGRGDRGQAAAAVRRHQRRAGQDVQADRRRAEGGAQRGMGKDVQPLQAADLR